MFFLVVGAALAYAPPPLWGGGRHATARAPARIWPRMSLTAPVLGHEGWMLYALQLAERGRLTTEPNPWVGCVIVAEDGMTVLAEGWHERKGGPHAEAAALAAAAASGVSREAMSTATAYVTLEPCHRGPGKTTPPCDEAMVASGLRRVHIAVTDPDPAFGGGAGIAYLRENGVEVVTGTAREPVAASLRPYLHQRRTGTPWVVLKVASAADGSIACADGTSQWITGPAARAHAQRLRAESGAILVGSGTALADRPRLTTREPALPAGWLAREKPPLRVLLDARGRVSDGPLLDTSLAPTLVLTTAASRGCAARAAWEAAAGVDVAEVPPTEEGGGVCLRAVLAELGERGVIQLMVEGGGQVLASFLRDAGGGLAHQLRMYVGATALGATARRWVARPLAETIADAPRWKLLGVEAVGDDVCVDYELGGPGAERE